MTNAPGHRSPDDYHDPTAGFGGAPPARSALTLRLVLAAFGLAVMVALGVISQLQHHPGYAVVSFVLAAAALIDLVVVIRRKARHEPR